MTDTASRNSQPSKSLGIFNLESETTEHELRGVSAYSSAPSTSMLRSRGVGVGVSRAADWPCAQIFEPFGPVTSVQLIRDKITGRSIHKQYVNCRSARVCVNPVTVYVSVLIVGLRDSPLWRWSPWRLGWHSSTASRACADVLCVLAAGKDCERGPEWEHCSKPSGVVYIALECQYQRGDWGVLLGSR